MFKYYINVDQYLMFKKIKQPWIGCWIVHIILCYLENWLLLKCNNLDIYETFLSYLIAKLHALTKVLWSYAIYIYALFKYGNKETLNT